MGNKYKYFTERANINDKCRKRSLNLLVIKITLKKECYIFPSAFCKTTLGISHVSKYIEKSLPYTIVVYLEKFREEIIWPYQSQF